MHWLQTLDVGLFHLINSSLANPFLDAVSPFASDNDFFLPAVVLVGVLLIWTNRLRGSVCVLMLLLIVPLGDGLVCNTLKHVLQRPRPYIALSSVRRPGRSANGTAVAPPMAREQSSLAAPSRRSGLTSMPSSHAANWFAATMILFIYYRRSVWLMLPLAVIVAFSRVYNGVHYPSDVLMGAVLGAGYAAGAVWSLDALWLGIGQKWFPLWWRRVPSLLAPVAHAKPDQEESLTGPLTDTPGFANAPHATIDQHWLRLGYIWIALCLVARLAYIASGTIELSGDEAYQWLWSKHLALSYFSKPPLIAYTQFLGTSLWGDNDFGVRFFSPIIGAILGFLLLRFLAREVNGRAGFFLLLILNATPLICAGSVLITVDPLSVLFWTAAMLAGWRAVQENGTTRQWLWVGLWMGLGFLSKYTELLQLLCWAVFFYLWPAARKHLRRPGPYWALLVSLLCALPVLIWNAQHHWVTVGHLADNANLDKGWRPTLRFLLEFIGVEAGLLNPIFFVAMIWAAVAFWRRSRHDPRLVYCFSMGAPVFLVYLLQSLRTRVLPNWIVPGVLPLFCLMVIYWDTLWRIGARKAKPWLIAGISLGFGIVILGHDTDLVEKLTGNYLPVQLDPLRRVRGFREAARVVEDARQRLLTEGKPVFIIVKHYGLAGQLSFYLPEAKAAVTQEPLVYYPTRLTPDNQFYFWPGYEHRKGQNAVLVRELPWDVEIVPAVPQDVERAFNSVTALGTTNVLYDGRVLRVLQLFACRGLQ